MAVIYAPKSRGFSLWDALGMALGPVGAAVGGPVGGFLGKTIGGALRGGAPGALQGAVSGAGDLKADPVMPKVQNDTFEMPSMDAMDLIYRNRHLWR